MPSSTEQDGQPGTALTNAEVARLMRVIQDKSFAETKALAAEKLTLNDEDGAALPDDEQALRKQTRADLKVYFDVIGDGTIRAGDDFSQERDREDIRKDIRLRLGLPAFSTIIAEQQADADATRRRGRRRCSSSFTTKTVFN
jgi:hypothetical protein